MALDIKKYPKADLENYYYLIFSFGLLLTMGVVIAAFEWKQYDKTVVDLQKRSVNTFEVIVDVPTTDIPEPLPPAQLAAPVIVEVADEEIQDEIKLDLDIEITQDTRVAEIIAPIEALNWKRKKPRRFLK